MKVTPVSFLGKYYDFVHNDPREKYSGFRLTMPNDEVVSMKTVNGFPYALTAGKIRETYIRSYYPNYHSTVSDDTVVGQDTTSYGLRYDVTAGNARDEILREEMAQKKFETSLYYIDFDNYRG